MLLSSDHASRRQVSTKIFTHSVLCSIPPTKICYSDEVKGLNRIFIDRSEELVTHSPELATKLPTECRKPDRVYGLRQTLNIQHALYATNGEGRPVLDLIQENPYTDEGHPLLLPFLVIEAKSGKRGCEWDEIRLQTAFPIFTFLQAQNSLRLANGERSKWQSGPLVWFLMNKGADWRVCAAYQSKSSLDHASLISYDTVSYPNLPLEFIVRARRL